jgi:hypothetical protein
MALNRRLCFTAQKPWVMMAYEMILLISSSFPSEIGAIFAACRCFVKLIQYPKDRRMEALNFQFR